MFEEINKVEASVGGYCAMFAKVKASQLKSLDGKVIQGGQEIDVSQATVPYAAATQGES